MAALTVDELMDWYLDGLDADERLSSKTRFDYRISADSYIRPWLGSKSVRAVTPDLIIKWQRRLVAEGGRKKGQSLSPNTVRLARAPLAGAFKAAIAAGLTNHNPLVDLVDPHHRPEPFGTGDQHRARHDPGRILGVAEQRPPAALVVFGVQIRSQIDPRHRSPPDVLHHNTRNQLGVLVANHLIVRGDRCAPATHSTGEQFATVLHLLQIRRSV
jgi:hypothetical protein